MKSLSLDLRRLELPSERSPDTPARSAAFSLLIHAAALSALVLIPLLGATIPPETASAFADPLVEPVLVSLPAPEPPRLQPSRNPRAAAPAAAASPTLAKPQDAASPLTPRVDDVLDPSSVFSGPGNLPGRTSDDGRTTGDCVLGALCGDGPAGTVEPDLAQTPRIGGIIREPRLQTSRPPAYPPLAQATGLSARITLEAHVDEDGRVREVRIVEGHPLFNEAALVSVRSRRYEPLLLNGVRSDFLLTVTVAFNIRR